MAQFLISVITIAVISAIVMVLTPKKYGISRYVMFVSSLAVALIMLIPIVKSIDYQIDYNPLETDEVNNVDYNQVAAQSLARAIQSSIENKFKESSLKIKIKMLDSENFEIEYIELIFRQNTNNKNDICEYISELFSCEVVLGVDYDK